MASQDWADKDFYAVLGVSSAVSETELRKAYRRLARQHHPDSNPDSKSAEARFKEISEAYNVLSDPASREEYDQIRAFGHGPEFTPGFNLGNLFNFGSVRYGDDSFSPFGRVKQEVRGQDLVAKVVVDLKAVVMGETVNLRNPSGGITRVKIPAGIEDGKKVRVRGKGAPSPSDGPPGDLMVTVQVRPNPLFKRDGNDLRINTPITFAEAVFGATIELPTITGDSVKIRVAANTPSGRVLRVKGLGVQGSNSKGDLLAIMQIVPPEAKDKQVRELLHRLAELTADQNPRQDLLEQASRI